MSAGNGRVAALAREIDEARAFIARLKVDIVTAEEEVVETAHAQRRAEKESAEAKERVQHLKSMLFVQKEKLAHLFERCFDEEHAR